MGGASELFTLHRRESHRRGQGHRLGPAWEKTEELERLLKEPQVHNHLSAPQPGTQ